MTTGVTLAVAWWQTALALGGLLTIIGTIVGIQIWSQRRRRRGEEATTSNAEGAEGMIYRPL